MLQRVTRPMNKDTEIMPLVRWQFRGGLPESQRKGWLFESVTDSRGRKFDGSVAVAIIGASTGGLRRGDGRYKGRREGDAEGSIEAAAGAGR